MRQWTAEERMRQAERIRSWQPWKKAGVKTPEGKARSRMNAFKHGVYSAEVKAMRRYLKECRSRIEWVNALLSEHNKAQDLRQHDASHERPRLNTLFTRGGVVSGRHSERSEESRETLSLRFTQVQGDDCATSDADGKQPHLQNNNPLKNNTSIISARTQIEERINKNYGKLLPLEGGGRVGVKRINEKIVLSPTPNPSPQGSGKDKNEERINKPIRFFCRPRHGPKARVRGPTYAKAA